MKRYSILSLLFIFFALGVVAQVDSLILPFGTTTLTDEQKASNPDYLAYPLMLASQIPEINCNQTTDCMEPVDLGLSVLWATCNVGAESPEEYGDYFAWGETDSKPKEKYDWTTYLYCKGTNKTMTKYCNDSNYGYNGFTDNKIVLDPEDDAATVNWGGSWRMPTIEEQDELRTKCTWTWITQNGVNGYKVVGPNGNSIFLPAAGCRGGSSLVNAGSYGYNWSSSLSTSYPYDACSVFFFSSSVNGSNGYRDNGRSVRPVCPKKQEHEYVDLGLSVKWATCNVGAEKPEDYGDYFAWVETEPKENYDWTTYKYCKGTNKTMTKYCNDSNYGYNGFTDNKTILDPEDDAATVNWGGVWRMPTDAEFIELREKCTWTWTTQNGVNGYQVVGPNGNSIFLPAAGYMSGTSLIAVGSDGDYWSSSLYSSGPEIAYVVYFISSYVDRSGIDRYNGQSVRPVVCPKKQEHEYVDLGLSVKWATCNVGAEKPEDYGDYFAWGETTPKENYDWITYLYCKGTNKTMTKYCTNSSYGYNGFTDNKTILDPEDDAATVNWGGNWRMPTDAEFTELREQCKWTWTTQNGVNGYQVVGPNGNSIFLPAAGSMGGTSLNNVGSDGYYWSSSLDTSFPDDAYGVSFRSSNVYRSLYYRINGQSVRPVCQ